MREIKTFVSPHGTRQVRLYQRDDGRFCFDEAYEDIEDLTEVGGTVERFWVPSYVSGLFDDAAAAEAELRAIMPWLRDAGGPGT